MGGGNSVTKNLMFNWVRETSDHGNFNSWDRLPFITDAAGKKGTDVLVTNMTNNFVISNYASTWPLDHDDGSCYYHDTKNYLVWAGAKNFLGQAKISAENIYVNVESNGFNVCAVDDSHWATDKASGKPINADKFENNTCITASGDLYQFSTCDPEDIPGTTDLSGGNTIMSSAPAAAVGFKCGSENLTLQEFQKQGYEQGSTLQKMPTPAEIAEMGRKLLGIGDH